MEPCSSEHGNDDAAVHLAQQLVGASMEPCSSEHGNRALGLAVAVIRHGFNGAVLIRARKLCTSRLVLSTRASFNGAVLIRARKRWRHDDSDEGSAASMEPCSSEHGNHGDADAGRRHGDAASMEPCSSEHGNDRCLRKPGHQDGGASMEPCSSEHGNAGERAADDRDVLASMEPCSSEHGNVVIMRGRLRRIERFNGAVLIRARKPPGSQPLGGQHFPTHTASGSVFQLSKSIQIATSHYKCLPERHLAHASRYARHHATSPLA